MRIITNTASLFRPDEGRQLGISILPVSVSVKGTSLRDYIDISPDDFIKLLREGAAPATSQPAVGDVIDSLEESDEETIMVTVGDGLSGEYMTALGVRNTLPGKEHIHIINSGSLGGPLRYLVRKAVSLREQGVNAKEIAAQLSACAASASSFIIPADFQYLRRSGRITQLTSKIGMALKLLPVLTQTEDHQRISLMSVKRTWKSAIDTVLETLRTQGVDDNYLISVEYADTRSLAEKVRARIQERFPRTESELLQLSPSLITHGGPGCIVVQAIHK